MEDTPQSSNEPKKINLEDLTTPEIQKTEPITLDIPAPTNLIELPQSPSKLKKILVPLIAAIVVLAAGAGTGAYFFIFKGNTDEETHASPDTTKTSELNDVSKELQEKLAPEDQISDTAIIEEPSEDTTIDLNDTTIEDTAITDDTNNTENTTIQPVKRVKRAP